MNISKATAQGLRDYQEDRFVVCNTKDGKLIAVMDGHGGTAVSDRIAKVIPTIWRKHIAFPASIFTAMKDTFEDIATLTNTMYEGSTLSLVFIPKANDVVFVAILGDSPVVIQNDEGQIHISPMHNARSNPAELAAAQERGGFFDGNYIRISYDGPGLQMTRVMGDREMGRIVSRIPEVYTQKVNGDSFVLVATDGLFDPSNRNTEVEAGTVAQYIREGASAETLVNRAIATPTGDNVTAVLVRFGNKKSRKKKKAK